MYEKDFFIHADRSKLQMSSSTEYRVEKLIEFKDTGRSVRTCKEELSSRGASFVLQHFDKLFSIIEFINQINYNDLHDIYDDILVKSLNLIGSFFSSYGNIEDIPKDTQHHYTNIIKMSVYLFIEFVHSFNLKIERDYKLLLLETKGKNKKQDMIIKHTTDYNWNWEDKLCTGIKAINSIMYNNITQLYEPPYIDHTFVTYIASCCYAQLENPSIAFVRNKLLCDSIMELLIILVTDYDHVQHFKVKVVQLLKLYEHLSIPLAKTVLQIVESGNNRSVIELIVKEIAENEEMEGLKEISSQEIAGGKSCCAFLVEIAKDSPTILLPNIEHLLSCLESDSYSMRICVLSVLKELIIHVLNNEELNEHEQKTRDDYLSILQDHLKDVNAYVRSKVIQLFNAIIIQDSLPKSMYKTIMNCAEDLLHDKSSYVTKSATQLIKTLIELNPYSFDFEGGKLQSFLKEENVRIKQLSDEINKKEIWISIEPSLKSFLEENFEESNLEICNQPDIEELPVIVKDIKDLITQREFYSAIKLIQCGKEHFKDEPLFKLQDEVDAPNQFFVLLKNIFWYENSIESIPSLDNEKYQQMSVEEIECEILSTLSSISHLQDASEYSKTIKKSLNTIRDLMFGEGTTSEVIESIEFFTTAHQFGVPNSKHGINAMLELIHSADANIKQAVMNSYKTIYLNIGENEDSGTRSITVMNRLVKLVKTLSVTSRKSFKVLINEWVQNKTLDNDCTMLLWAWFTESTKTIHYEDRIVAALLISFLSSANPSIAKGNLDSIIQHGICEDYLLFNYSCKILESAVDVNFDRFPKDHDLVCKILKVTEKYFNLCDIKKFNDVAANAIKIIYLLTELPDSTTMALIGKLYTIMKNNSRKDDLSKQKKSVHLDIKLFTKFLSIIGHVAIQQCFYVENYISKKLVQGVKTKYQAKKTKSENISQNNDAHSSEAAEIDSINDKIRETCDKNLVCRSGFLSNFSDHIIKACNSNYSNLRVVGAVTLIKFMYVSESFCQKHLMTFLNLLQNSDSMEISIELINGFGSLIFKHPNLLEPKTNYLYARLKDKCNLIRFSALMTVIDLMRQEIVKVKSQVAGIAKLLVDEDLKIKYAAMFFFANISEKGNTLYNVLFDIISILSNPEDMIPKDDFLEIMKYLFLLIKKDRQIEALVEKLTIRLKESNNDNQEYYLSSCLMLIKHTDKSLTKLSENIFHYKDKLKNPLVYDNFKTIITTNSRMVNPVTKDILNELTDKIGRIVLDENFPISLSQKTPGKRLTTVKKKPVGSAIKVCKKAEKGPLLFVSEPSTSSHTPFLSEPSTSSHTPFVSEPSTSSHTPFVSEPCTSSHTPFVSEPSTSSHTPFVSEPSTSSHTPFVSEPSTSSHTNVKRKLIMIDSKEEEENDEEISSEGMSNFRIVKIRSKVDEVYEIVEKREKIKIIKKKLR